MNRLTLVLVAAVGLSLGLSGLVAAQPPGPPGGAANLMAPPPDATPPKAAPPGPYAVTIEANPGLLTHTIYRPADLAPFTGDRRLPIVAWGNGACSNAGLGFQIFLSNIASHGFVIIVSGPKDAPLPKFPPPGAAPPPMPPPGGALPFPMTKDADMQTALNWAVAETARVGSPYYHRLDPDKIAVMGQSCGGLQAINNSADPRVKTSMIWNSGTFPDGGMPMKMSGATKASLALIHAPIAYINGGPHDIAFANANDDVSRIQGVPVFEGWINVGHGGTYWDPGGGRFAPIAVAWLQWRLNGDMRAARMFEGVDCGLCNDPVWHITKKDME
jgi:hypothetical protein